MSIERIYLLVSVIVGFVFLTSVLTNNVFAVDYLVFDENSCKDFPGNFDSWDDPTSTCSRTNDLTINLDDTLIIPNGVTLKFPSNRDLINRGEITNDGFIDLASGGSITNRGSAKFTNSGMIQLTGAPPGNSILENRDNAVFTNTLSGEITITGINGNRGQVQNEDTASFTNSGTITITGTDGNSGQLQNVDVASFTNSGTIIIVGTSGNSGQLLNQNDANISNSGTITLNGVNDNSGQIQNINNGIIINICGIITFKSIIGNSIQEDPCTPLTISGGSDAYEDPTIGKSHNGKQVVENGICIDIQCWTVTADYHQDFELVEMLSDSIHTISTTVFCQNGVVRCNYVAFGVSPYGTNINDSVWKIILQKDHKDNWTMKIIDPDVYLGEVTSTTQIVNDGKHLSASATIEFKKPTPGMILNVEVRDSKGGYRDFKFNDGIAITDAYAYPKIETSYDPPLKIKPLCLNEDPTKRYTCAFALVKEWTIKNAEATLEQIMK